MSTLAIKPLPAELQLGVGSHSSPERGMCLLEAASYVAGEPFSDHPKCVCPALARFGRNLNDVLPDEQRQRLLPFVPRLLGTADDGKLQERGLAAARWLITVYTPTWLDLAGIEHKLRELPANSWDDVVAAQPQLDDAKQRAAAAWDAARAAAWDAALDAARDAARAAARDAARAAARDAARAAARDESKKKLSPAVTALQNSAIELFESMLPSAA